MKYDTTNECAFPCHQPEEMGIREGYFSGGMSLRQFAAIQLRVPDSGDEQIDAMIRKANRRDFAGQAMAGLLANPSVQSLVAWECAWDEKAETPRELAEACALQSVIMADALIEELNR
jgi:hypothetical protein